ncbi:hypothetical protein A3A66_00275 [Microgenomates group bacterium RIFCSPLOWO2_01_FULL_46_13]|nr:MAG: hypothetical protein A2783_03555 [Microgenomates group bacterium RIFCSPHIGHO2_01_FULL_45_11]OGV94452.1 MAG: hypothetical protein A3A66_00275 [Microgenomates group bacterium RIFCSPLOWO2_01_FULL_46_13]
MKRLLLSLAIIAGVSALVLRFSGAFLSDTEISSDNVLEAGEVDLQIDNESFYNGDPSPDTSWGLNDLTSQLFFNFTDLKPGDYGEDTISIHGDTNPYWACMDFALTKDDDISCTEPELLDDHSCDEPNGDLFDGELGKNLLFMFWVDDGDNVLESDELEKIFHKGSAPTVLDSQVTLADAATNIFGTNGQPLEPSRTYYIGKAWCFGSLLQPLPLQQNNLGPDSPITPANSTGGIYCDGSILNNATQTDALMTDITFNALQARHDPNFTCSGQPGPSPTPPIACSEKVDTMLVLDRSGSISSSELTDLKNAANAFVTTLAPSTDGAHIGMSSFATTGTLNLHLTATEADVHTAINAITSGGFTNLKEGIDLAKIELDNPGDNHDRADADSPDFIIIITDGNPNRPEGTAETDAANSADNARAAGVEVFVVGVGSDVDATYLTTEIADDASHYFAAADFDDLQAILEGLATCPE